MQKRSSYFPLFFVYSALSIFLLLLTVGGASQPLRGIIEKIIVPVQKNLFVAFAQGEKNESILTKEEEQVRLYQLKIEEQEREIRALRDQFQTTQPSSETLLPAEVIGFESFIPGVSKPKTLTLDKGSKDGIKIGHVIVVKDILIGRVSRVSDSISIVDLTTKEGFSITAKTSTTNALGVLKGQGSTLLLDNVVVSESLKKDDFVLTKGSRKDDGTGSPPDLVLGKVSSVVKKPSSLFQTAEIESLVDITRVSIVFVLK